MRRHIVSEILKKNNTIDNAGDKQDIKGLLEQLKRKNIGIRFGGLTDENLILEQSYCPESGESSKDSYFMAKLDVDWPLPQETDVYLDWDAWKKRTQILYSIFAWTLPSVWSDVPINSYDDIAQRIKFLVASLHKENNSFISLINYPKNFVLGRYNIKKALLLVGWCSIYGKDLQEKYKINDYLPQPKGIILEKEGENMILTCAKSYSDYLGTGWDEESKSWWEKIGGKIIYKKPAKRTSRNDGKTFIVDKVDESTGEAKFKPFKLP